MPESTFPVDLGALSRTTAGRPRRRRTRVQLGRAALLLYAVGNCVGATWLPLEEDGVHDPSAPGVRLLQQPADALGRLSPDSAGNRVRWVDALDKGEIKPREALRTRATPRFRDDDILLNLNGGMPIVRFPHRVHSLWLDCSNCHDHLFKPVAGANRLSMFAILQGEQCGVCHGAVSFPLTECTRCHSVARSAVNGKPAQAAQGGALVPAAK